MAYWTSMQLTIYITCEITQGIENTNSDWRFVKALKFGMGPLKELLFSHLLHIICNVVSKVVNVVIIVVKKEIVLGTVKFKIRSSVTQPLMRSNWCVFSSSSTCTMNSCVNLISLTNVFLSKFKLVKIECGTCHLWRDIYIVMHA
jgi:hypothetical protein